MTKHFSLDLIQLRTMAGLDQKDCAVLLGVNKSQMCRIEKGTRTPSVREVCKLSLIFDQPVGVLCAHLIPELKRELLMRLHEIKIERRASKETDWRYLTLTNLEGRLLDVSNPDHGA